MFSLKQCAVLATALIGSVAASPAHEVLHKRHAAPVAAPAPVEKRGEMLGGVFKKICLEGLNVNTTQAPIAMDDSLPFVMDLVNESDQEIGIVLWSAYNQVSSWSAFTVNVARPNITITIEAGANTSVSFDPSLYTAAKGFPGAAGSLSGALAPIYNDTTADYSGGVKDVWVEFTFVAGPGAWSTLDASYLLARDGHDVTIETYASKDSERACISDRTRCVYVCPDNQESCNGAACTNCDGNTGCRGMGPTSGYVKTTFY